MKMHLPGNDPKLSYPRHTLVTGGAGFIGSHLCDSLLQRGDRVICVDNLFTGSMRNIRPLLNHPHFQFIEHDVRHPLRIDGRTELTEGTGRWSSGSRSSPSTRSSGRWR